MSIKLYLPILGQIQFSVPQIEYPLGGSSKTGSQVLLHVDSCHGITIVTSGCTIVTSEQHLYQTIVQFPGYLPIFFNDECTG